MLRLASLSAPHCRAGLTIARPDGLVVAPCVAKFPELLCRVNDRSSCRTCGCSLRRLGAPHFRVGLTIGRPNGLVVAPCVANVPHFRAGLTIARLDGLVVATYVAYFPALPCRVNDRSS